jgi:hypothetical protein
MAPPDDPDAPPPPEVPAASAWRAPLVGMLAGLAVVVLAIAAAVVFGLGRGDDTGRVVVEVVGLHDRPPQGAPPLDAAASSFARRAARGGWRATGARTDTVQGRATVTVHWERAGRQIAHTTVGGGPVDAPRGSRRTGRRGVLLRSFDPDGRIAVTWDEAGATHVISAIGISRAALYNLAGGRPLR